jgi:hypothetical protein
VAEAERFPLAHVGEVDQVRDLADLGEQVLLAPGLEKGLELDGHVEVVLDRVLSAPGDEDDVVDARRHRFFHAVLDDRLVDERQHFLRLRLGGGQEPGTQARRREDRFTNRFAHRSLSIATASYLRNTTLRYRI